MFKLVDTKIGEINVNNIKKHAVRVAALTFGVVCIGSGMYIHSNIQDNKNTDKVVSNTITTVESKDYAKSLEAMLDVNIDDKYHKDVNILCEYYQEIDDYIKNGQGTNSRLLPKIYDVEKISLGILKKEIADDNDISVDDVKTYVGTYGIKAKIVKDDKRKEYALHGDARRVALSIARLQAYNKDTVDRNDALEKVYAMTAREVILDTIKFVDSKENYKIPFDVDYKRGL